MNQVLLNNADFAALACGSLFFALAALARIPRPAPAPALPGAWLAAFSILHGLFDWSGIAIRSFDDPRFVTLNVGLLALSFLALLEFARRLLAQSRTRWLTQRWLYLALLLATAFEARGGTSDFLDATRLFLGVPAAWFSAIGLFRIAADPPIRAQRIALRTAAFILFVFGTSLGTLSLSSEIATPVPLRIGIQLSGDELRGLLLHAFIACGLCSCLWIITSSSLKEHQERGGKQPPFLISAPMVALLLALVAVWFATDLITRSALHSIRHSLQERAFGITTLLAPAALSDLTGPTAEENQRGRLLADQLLQQAQRATPEVRVLYLFTHRDNELVPIAQSADLADEDENWGELVADFDRFFEQTASPPNSLIHFRDDHIVTTIVPVLAPFGHESIRAALALGLNVSARPYETIVARWRLVGLAAGALLIMFILDFSIRHYQLWISALQLAEAEQRQRRLSDTLEERVVHRTRELAESNAALHREMEKLQEAEIKYRTLADHVPVITYRVDLGERNATTFISPQIKDILGFTPEEWMADPQLWLHVIPEEDRERVHSLIQEHDRTGEPANLEFQMLDRSGRPHWIRCSQRYQRDESGALIHAHGVMMDVTETMQTLQQLRKASERYRLIFDYSPAGLFHYDHSLRITEVNNRFAALLDRPRADLIGADLAALASEEVHATLASALRGGEGYFEGARGFLSLPTDSWISVLAAPLYSDDADDASGFAVVQDLSEQRRIEEERMRTQKLESLGLLAGGIAHDFNNILTAILGNISLARQMAASGSDFRDSLRDAERASFRAQELTRQLLTFAKGGAPVKQLHDIPAVIREAASFTVRGSASHCVYAFAPDTWKAEIDAGQITQILQNLIINADQAMPHGGTITLETKNRRLVENEVPNLQPGPYVEVRVSDTGSGIPDRLLGRIFDPYFTTKTKGTGLGLTMCFSIIQKHGGHILAESTEGQGTTFTFYLPATPEGSAPAAPAAALDMESLRGSARILIMDDERTILELCRRTLQKAGYSVLTAAHGAEALRIYDEETAAGRPIDLAILDMTVPGGMGGSETLSALRERTPHIPALVSSGYAQDDALAEYSKAGFVGAIPKPYRAQDLLAAIARALETKIA
ncbi:MAG: ATP-binding protein [Kiritimatiellae bacterium]|nr:ATP-binding protein [Kiritimatiellia bacterium]